MSSSSANVLRSVKNLDEDNDSITDNTENINPQAVHLYNITEYKPLNQEEQQSLFDDINKIREARVKGSYIPVQNLISLFKTADESTIVHELGHWYLNSLQQDANNGSAKAQDKLDVVVFFCHKEVAELCPEV